MTVENQPMGEVGMGRRQNGGRHTDRGSKDKVQIVSNLDQSKKEVGVLKMK